MSDVPEITCTHCAQTVRETALIYRQVNEERCPHCREVVRKGEGWGGANVAAMFAGDVAAIDEWLEGHGVDVRRVESGNRKQTLKWSFKTPYRWECEIIYEENHPHFVSIRFTTSERGEAVVANMRQFQIACAKHGVQPHGDRSASQTAVPGGVKRTVEVTWGAVQYLSVNTLCEELFDPVFKRLDAAMSEVLRTLPN